MAITKNAQNYHERMFPGYESKLLKTDPEFIELFDNFFHFNWCYTKIIRSSLFRDWESISFFTRS